MQHGRRLQWPVGCEVVGKGIWNDSIENINALIDMDHQDVVMRMSASPVELYSGLFTPSQVREYCINFNIRTYRTHSNDLKQQIKDYQVCPLKDLGSKWGCVWIRCPLVETIGYYSQATWTSNMQALKRELEQCRVIEFPTQKLSCQIESLKAILPVNREQWNESHDTPGPVERRAKWIDTIHGLGSILQVSLLRSRSKADNAVAPVVQVSRDMAVMNHFVVRLDVLGIFPATTTVDRVVKQLVSSLVKQFDRVCALVSDVNNLQREIHTYHFRLNHGVPVQLTADFAHDTMASRQALHKRFLLDLTRPYFRQECAIQHEPTTTFVQLINVHEGIPSSPVVGGTQTLVQGLYRYYHYMQDSFNDKGWGCAYRSLQTIASWLEMNHYTSVPVPTHDQIQQTLVKIGDKPRGFVGTKDWIGSVEIGFVLDERYGVVSKSVSVERGPDLADKASIFEEHFASQGTPVMIGGGALALTLLGIDYNASTGDLAFLILDPHYTGADDLKIIQNKTISLEGYRAIPCGWRRASSFASNSFYNVCLPQRPKLM